MEAIIILTAFGISTAWIGKAKGSSAFVWFLVGFCLPFIGLIAVILYRVEHDEPERPCPRCHATLKLYEQVCRRCGLDLDLPDPADVTIPSARARASAAE